MKKSPKLSQKFFLPALAGASLFIFVLFSLSGCSFLTEAKSYDPPPFEKIHVKPWRIINRCKPGHYGGTLSLADFGTGPQTFNPITADDATSAEMATMLFSALLDYNYKTNQIVPGLAYKWTHSKNKLIWTFYLRKGLRWSNGTSITAQDVVFSYHVMEDPNVPNLDSSYLFLNGKPIQVKAVNPTAVRFILPSPDSAFLFGVVGSMPIVSKKSLEKAYKDHEFEAAYGVSTPPDKIVVSGAYEIQEYDPQQRIILTRNPYFYAKDIKRQRLPYLNHIVITYVRDYNTWFLKFISGDIDAFPVFPPKFYNDLKAGEKRGNYRLENLGPGGDQSIIIFNENPHSKFLNKVKYRWFTNKLFRQGIAYSIDRQTMIKLCYNGFGYDDIEDFSPGSLWYDPNVPVYHHDPQKAKKLFREAGFHWKHGKMYDQYGNRVEFSLLTNSGNNIRLEKGELIQSDLAKMGIKVHFHSIDFNTLITKLDNNFDYEAILLGWIGSGDIEPSENDDFWLSNAEDHQWYPLQKKPATPWEAEIDKLAMEGISTYNFKKRKKIYDKLEQILYTEEPQILLPVKDEIFAFSNKVGNADPTVIGEYLTYNTTDDMLMDQAYMKHRAEKTAVSTIPVSHHTKSITAPARRNHPGSVVQNSGANQIRQTHTMKKENK